VTEKELDVARRLWGWVPHSKGQRDWLLCDAHEKVAACGRRWGKSESTAIDVALFALSNPHSRQFIIAPTDDQTKIIMDEVSRRLHAVPGLKTEFKEVKSPFHSITFLDAQGFRPETYIAGRTAGGKGLRGHKAHRVIEDEAAFIDDDVHNKVISPLLLDFDGKLIKISTPNGLAGHFYESFMKGESGNPRVQRFHFPSDANPHISKAYLEEERRTKPQHVFSQEYEASFLPPEGSVFRGVKDAIDEGEKGPRTGEAPYWLGLDVARAHDWTVICVVDNTGRQVYMDRFQLTTWEVVYERAAEVARRFDAKILMDSTGVGDPGFESLRKLWHKVEGYRFTSGSKESLIDNLVLKLERGETRMLDIEVQTNEFLSYTYEVSTSGYRRMNAPNGMHDDCVIAYALAMWPLRPIKTWNLEIIS
jgi:hypothetical protein